MHWTKDPSRRADLARTVAAMQRARRRAARKRRQARRSPPPAPTVAQALAGLEARLEELATMRRALELAIAAARDVRPA